MAHRHSWRIYFDGNFASDNFGEKGAHCYFASCSERLTADEVNRRLNAVEKLPEGHARTAASLIRGHVVKFDLLTYAEALCEKETG